VSEMSAQAPADAVRTQNKQQNTPMHFACRGGHLDVCKWLASEVPEEIKKEKGNQMRRTPIMEKCGKTIFSLLC